jgi:hypothetical protein
MDPFTWGLGFLMSNTGMAALSTATAVAGAVGAGQQAAAVGRQNQRILNEQADATMRATNDRESVMRRRNAEGFSAQRTAMLQNGVDASTGTALIGYEQQLRDAELDALTLRYEGLMQARGQRIEGQMARWEGRAKRRQAYLSAAGTLLGASGNYLTGRQDPSKVPVEDRSIRFTGYGGRY